MIEVAIIILQTTSVDAAIQGNLRGFRRCYFPVIYCWKTWTDQNISFSIICKQTADPLVAYLWDTCDPSRLAILRDVPDFCMYIRSAIHTVFSY